MARHAGILQGQQSRSVEVQPALSYDDGLEVTAVDGDGVGGESSVICQGRWLMCELVRRDCGDLTLRDFPSLETSIIIQPATVRFPGLKTQ